MSFIAKESGKYKIFYKDKVLGDMVWHPVDRESYKTLKQAQAALKKVEKKINEDVANGYNRFPIDWYKIVKTIYEFVP